MMMGGINSSLSFWITNDLDDGHLEYVYASVAALTFITTCAYVFVSRHFDINQSKNELASARFLEDYERANETGLSPDWQRHPVRVYKSKKQRALSAAL